MHGQSTYVPVSNCTPLCYPEPTCPGYLNQILPPFAPSFTPSDFNSQTGMEEAAAITIKKEPNFHMHSPTVLYPEQHHVYYPEHFPFPPITGPSRPLINNKRPCLHVDPKGIEGKIYITSYYMVLVFMVFKIIYRHS